MPIVRTFLLLRFARAKERPSEVSSTFLWLFFNLISFCLVSTIIFIHLLPHALWSKTNQTVSNSYWSKIIETVWSAWKKMEDDGVWRRHGCWYFFEGHRENLYYDQQEVLPEQPCDAFIHLGLRPIIFLGFFFFFHLRWSILCDL